MADYKKPDHWLKKARIEGYPARSVYKLQEIDKKYSIFKNNNTQLRVLDIGAAPGSWSLFVLRKLGDKVFLAAADLSPLSHEFDKGFFEKENFFFIQGDITDVKVREQLYAKGPYSVIISDAAPATTGSHTIDSARSYNLAEEVVNYAEAALAPGGCLVVKIFQGGDSAVLLKRMKTLFETAKSFKPEACRGESFETYYIGLRRVQQGGRHLFNIV